MITKGSSYLSTVISTQNDLVTVFSETNPRDRYKATMESDDGGIPTAFQFNREVNVTGAPMRDDDMQHISALRAAYMKEISGKDYPSSVIQYMSTDESLHRYLRARNGNVQKALKMVVRTTEWRSVRFIGA